eukprot:7380987-Prymnesium_polylepis.1
MRSCHDAPPLLIKQSKADARRAGRISSVADHVEEAECNVIIKAHGICGLRHDDQRRCKFDESKSMLRADDSMADSMRESLPDVHEGNEQQSGSHGAQGEESGWRGAKACGSENIRHVPSSR